MKYFKNAEVARLYNVSEKAVRNWIERAAGAGLELFKKDGKLYIIDSMKNAGVLEELARKSRKFRNKRSHRDLKPRSEMYSLYSPAQIAEIVNSLELYRELPLKFKYTGQGAILWEAYLNKLHILETDNYISNSVNFLRDNWIVLDRLVTAKHSKINVVDIGVGNGLVVTELLQKIIDQGKLNKYIGIDISPELLDITENNLQTWLRGQIQIEKHVKDITYDRFHQHLSGSHPGSMNLILFLGGTITNFKDPSQPLKVIRDSMGKNDLLICTLKLDSLRARSFFDFNLTTDSGELPERSKWFLELLNVEDSMYEPEQFFDETIKCRLVRAKLKVSITLHFNVGEEERIVEVRKGESIQLSDMWHYSDADIEAIFRDSGFEILHTSKSESQQFMLIMARIKTEESKF